MPDWLRMSTISPIGMPAGAIDWVPPAVWTVDPTFTRPCDDESSTNRSTNGLPEPCPFSVPVSRMISSGVVVVVVNSGTPVSSGASVVDVVAGSSTGSSGPCTRSMVVDVVFAGTVVVVVVATVVPVPTSLPELGPWPSVATVIVGCCGASVSTFAPIEKSGSVMSNTTLEFGRTWVILPTRPPPLTTGIPTAMPSTLPLSISTV